MGIPFLSTDLTKAAKPNLKFVIQKYAARLNIPTPQKWRHVIPSMYLINHLVFYAWRAILWAHSKDPFSLSMSIRQVPELLLNYVMGTL